MLSRSNGAQVESVASMTGANWDGLPSSPSKLNCSHNISNFVRKDTFF